MHTFVIATCSTSQICVVSWSCLPSCKRVSETAGRRVNVESMLTFHLPQFPHTCIHVLYNHINTQCESVQSCMSTVVDVLHME